MRKFNISLELPSVQKCIKELKKKFPKAELDVNKVFEELEKAPSVGSDPIPGFGRKIWKKRFRDSSSAKGKRGGFRVVFYWKEGTETIYPVFIYHKSMMEDVPKKDILEALKSLEE